MPRAARRPTPPPGIPRPPPLTPPRPPEESDDETEEFRTLRERIYVQIHNKADGQSTKSKKLVSSGEPPRESLSSPADHSYRHPDLSVQGMTRRGQRQLRFFDRFTYRPRDLPTLIDDIMHMLPFRRRLIVWLAPPVSTGKKRVWWRCSCGEPLYDDVPETTPIAVQMLQRQPENNAQTHAGEETRNQDQEQARPLMQWLPSWNGILNPMETIAMVLRNVLEPPGIDSELPFHNTNVSRVSDPQDPERDNLHLLLCIDKNHKISIKQECLGTIGDDKELFTFLRDQYGSVRPRGRSWFTLRALKTIRLVKFDMDVNMVPDVYDCPRDGSHNAMCICLPPVKRIESGEYRCSPQPEMEPEEGKHPAVKPSHLKHYFDGRHPMEVIDRRCLDQIPKRVKGPLAVLPGPPAVGWGLHFEEGWSFSAICIVILIFVVPGMGLSIGSAITSRDYRQVASAIISMASLVIPLVLFLRDKDK